MFCQFIVQRKLDSRPISEVYSLCYSSASACSEASLPSSLETAGKQVTVDRQHQYVRTRCYSTRQGFCICTGECQSIEHYNLSNTSRCNQVPRDSHEALIKLLSPHILYVTISLVNLSFYSDAYPYIFFFLAPESHHGGLQSIFSPLPKEITVFCSFNQVWMCPNAVEINFVPFSKVYSNRSQSST